MSLIKSNGGGLGGSGSPGGSLGSFYSHTIDQSVRLDNSSGAHLVNAAASPTATNRKKVTISCWVKRAVLGSGVYTIFHGGANGLMMQFGPTGADEIYIYQSPWQIYKDALLIRDTSAWYHFALILDSTQSTDSNRAKFYINGQLEDLSTWQVGSGAGRYPGLNVDFNWHTGTTQRIGSTGGTDDLAGYIAEFISIDGQDVSISDLGETKDGVWVPKDVSGLTLGDAGFYLPFSQDRTVGASAFFSESDNSYVSWTDPGSEYEIGASDDYTLELFFWPTTTELSGNAYIAGYYKTTSPTGYFALQPHFSSRNIYLYHANGTNYTFGTYASGAVDAGRWHHLAINRSSGNLRCFLDGAQVGSTIASNTKEHDIPEFRVNKAHATSNNTFDGYISNVRLVIGSAVYSDGSSITVPTSTLTAVTNTKLLALTTTTITADASSNNVTGTASGTAGSGYYATNALSPFPNAAFNEDAGSNGIDFSANNIFDHDIVPDSPTNNWCTLNFNDSRTSQGWDDGSLTWLASSLTYTAHSTMVIPEISDSDTYYAECRRNSNGYARGISPVTLSGANNNTSVSGMLMLYDNGRRWNGSSYEGSDNNEYATISAGDVFGIKAGNGELRFFQNGNDLGAAFTGLSGSYKFANFAAGSTGTGQTWNFGQDSTFGGLEAPGTTTDKNGFGLFHDSEAANNISLCASNIADPTIGPGASTQADDKFNTVLYTGDGNDPHAITGVGFQPDWVWIKGRNTAYQHSLYDSVRGTNPNGGRIASDGNYAENIAATNLKSFDSDGFTLSTKINSNENTKTYVAWNWKAGGSANTFNIDGTGYSSMSDAGLSDGTQALTGLSVNTTSKFSIATFTMPDAQKTVAHGLGVKPDWVIFKNRSTGDWQIWHNSFAENTEDVILLNSTAGTAQAGGAANWFQAVSTTLITIQSAGAYFGTGDYVMYSFANVEGYSKFDKYVGNGNADGTFVFTGFRPAWVMIKKASASGNWILIDAERSTFNLADDRLIPNATSTESAANGIDMLSNGFKIRSTDAQTSTSGATFIYFAFAETPFKFANAR